MQVTELEIAVVGLATGTFVLVSGIIGVVWAYVKWNRASGGTEDIHQLIFALVVVAVGCLLLILGGRATSTLSHSALPRQAKSEAPAMRDNVAAPR
jgi:uncharacterized protein involved in response to NO